MKAVRGFARSFDELFDTHVFNGITRKSLSQSHSQGLGQGQGAGQRVDAGLVQLCQLPGTTSKPIKLRRPSEWQHVVDQMGNTEYGMLSAETKLALLDWLSYEMISCSMTHTYLSSILKEKLERDRERAKSNPRVASDEYVPVATTSRRKSIESKAAAAATATTSGVAVAVPMSSAGGGLTLSLVPPAAAAAAANTHTSLTTTTGPSPGTAAVAPTHLRLGDPPPRNPQYIPLPPSFVHTQIIFLFLL